MPECTTEEEDDEEAEDSKQELAGASCRIPRMMGVLFPFLFFGTVFPNSAVFPDFFAGREGMRSRLV